MTMFPGEVAAPGLMLALELLGGDPRTVLEPRVQEWRARAAELRRHADELSADAAAIRWRSESARAFQELASARITGLAELADLAERVAAALEEHSAAIVENAQTIADTAGALLDEGRSTAEDLMRACGETVDGARDLARDLWEGMTAPDRSRPGAGAAGVL